eukprot:CAMPEP_0196663988 /NCGR_PEP_ID=MMETSP1086-20130531/55054_1 /TAXON_ID=77921 /ORGANISM="Cyanoptyche  gloeocystis , Strain SAG4.97" /LENGTH=101 /DNA_ID=CAMNT_0042000031 /DNA_START=32 /DNA_END=337 /DNA_ORIENTATION=-
MADTTRVNILIPPRPENFDPENPKKDIHTYNDYVAWSTYDQWLKVGELHVVRDELRKCYYKEGVNHYQKCRKLALEYIELSKQAGWAHKFAVPLINAKTDK